VAGGLTSLAAASGAEATAVDAKAAVTARVDSEFASLEAIFHRLHANPELSFQEFETAALVARELRAASRRNADLEERRRAAEAEAAKNSRQEEAAEAGSTAVASWQTLGCAQCPVLPASHGACLIADTSFAVEHIPCS
jgi:hypothetical protein